MCRWDTVPTGFKILYFLIPYSWQCSSGAVPSRAPPQPGGHQHLPCASFLEPRVRAISKMLLPLAAVGLSLLDEHPALSPFVPSAQLLREPAFPKVLFDY